MDREEVLVVGLLQLQCFLCNAFLSCGCARGSELMTTLKVDGTGKELQKHS